MPSDKTIFAKSLNCAFFFPTFAPDVRNWKHKLRGRDGNGKPITFSRVDQVCIKDGLDRMNKQITATLDWDVRLWSR